MKKIIMLGGVVQADLINKRWTQRRDTAKEMHFNSHSTSLAVIAFWYHCVGALCVMRSANLHPYPVALRSLKKPLDTEWSGRMSCAVVAVLSLLVTFVFSSQRLIAGLTAGAVKS